MIPAPLSWIKLECYHHFCCVLLSAVLVQSFQINVSLCSATFGMNFVLNYLYMSRYSFVILKTFCLTTYFDVHKLYRVSHSLPNPAFL